MAPPNRAEREPASVTEPSIRSRFLPWLHLSIAVQPRNKRNTPRARNAAMTALGARALLRRCHRFGRCGSYALGVAARAGRGGVDAMEKIFSAIRVETFWNILLFVHFVLSVGLLAAVTLQAVAVLMPARQAAGHFIDRGPVPAAAYTTLIIVLYVVQALMGAWIYVKYRTYVRIPMEEF